MVSPAGYLDGYPGGPIAAVSREPGMMDVVFRPWSEADGPTWYTLNQTHWALGSLPGVDVSNAISIVAPTSTDVRVFVKNYWNNVYTMGLNYSAGLIWSPLQAVETLTPEE